MAKNLIRLLLILTIVCSLVSAFAYADEDTALETAEIMDAAELIENNDVVEYEADIEEHDTALSINEEISIDEDELEDSPEDDEIVEITFVGLTEGIRYSDADNQSLTGVEYWIGLYGGYSLKASGGVAYMDDYYWCDEEGQTYHEYLLVFEGSEPVTLSVIEDSSTPNIVTVDITLPDNVTASEIFPYGIATYTLQSNELGSSLYYIELYGEYSLQLPDDVEILYIGYGYDSGGNMYHYYSLSITASGTVTLAVVEEDDVPAPVTITTLLPEDTGWSDVFYYYGPESIISADSYDYFTLSNGYSITADGGSLLASSGDVYYKDYALYPDEGVSEITLTITEIPSGTLAVSGAVGQVVSIKDASGNELTAGDTVKGSDLLCITLNQGYVVDSYRSSSYDSATGTMTYYVPAEDITEDGIVSVNIKQGVLITVIDEDGGYDLGAVTDGYTYLPNAGMYIVTAAGYIAEFSGADVTVDTYYYCDAYTDETASDSSGDTVGVYAYYEFSAASAGTLTIAFREATEEDDVPTPIQVQYIDDYDALLEYSTYVLPGGSVFVRLEEGYTAEFSGAAADYFYEEDDWNISSGIVDEDAGAVTITIVPIQEDAVLNVLDEDGNSASDVVVETSDSVSDGDTLLAGINYLYLQNGYEVSSVDGAVWAETGYHTDEDTIYVGYQIIPTGDPADVTVTVAEESILATVTIIDNGISATVYGNYEEQISSNEFTVLTKNSLGLIISGLYTVRVTGADITYAYADLEASTYIVQPTSENVTVEIVTFEEMEADANNNLSDNESESDGNSSQSGGNQPGSGSQSDNSSGKIASRTEDESNAALWASLAILFAASAGVVLNLIRKRNM